MLLILLLGLSASLGASAGVFENANGCVCRTSSICDAIYQSSWIDFQNLSTPPQEECGVSPTKGGDGKISPRAARKDVVRS